MDQITIYKGPILTITNNQMKKVDYLMENKYGINLYQMMENVGRSLAILSREYFGGKNLRGKKMQSWQVREEMAAVLLQQQEGCITGVQQYPFFWQCLKQILNRFL